MKAEPLEPRQVQLTVVVPPERVAQEMFDVAQQFARRQRIPGYRPGKVPLARVVALVGEAPIREAAAEQLTKKVVREAMTREHLESAAPVTVETVRGEPLTLRAIVPLPPEVRLGDYHALRVPPPETPAVEESAIDAAIEVWQRDLTALAPVERPAVAGDTMTLDVVARDGEHVVLEQTALRLALDGESARQAGLPPGIVDELVGLASGDSRAFTVTYSEFWPDPALQGREVAVEVRVTQLEAMIRPEVDEAFARRLGAESVDKLRDGVRGQLALRAILEAHEHLVGAAVDALVSVADVSFPPQLLDREIAVILADLRARVEKQGFTWERWLELQGKDEESLWREAESDAESALRRRVVMSEFVRLEGIDVTRAEIDDEVQDITQRLSESARRGLPDREELRRSTSARLLTGRAVRRLLEIVAPEAETAAAAGSVATGETGPAGIEAAAATGETVPPGPSGAAGQTGQTGKTAPTGPTDETSDRPVEQ